MDSKRAMILPVSAGTQQRLTAPTTLDVPAIVQTKSYDHIDQIQADAIRTHAKQLGRPLSILEAGCGQKEMTAAVALLGTTLLKYQDLLKSWKIGGLSFHKRQKAVAMTTTWGRINHWQLPA